MNTLTKATIGLGIALSLVFSVVAINKTPGVVRGINGSQGQQGERGLQGPAGPAGPQGPQGAVGAPGRSAALGSVTSPDLPWQYIGVGGVRTYRLARTLVQASSTVCSIQSPAATSTLISGGIRFVLASTTAVVFDLSKSTSPSASTTKIGSTYGLAASAQATVFASTTGSVSGDPIVFPPSNYFNVVINGIGTADGSGNAPTGVCQASFEVI